MTPEQKREQLLKRMLPALTITVIYFVFVSGFIGEQKDKAEDEYIKLMQKGISPESIPSLDRQIEMTNKQIAALKSKQTELQNKIKEMAGFVGNSSGKTQTSAQLAEILVENNLQVINEESTTLDKKELPPAIKDIKTWLQPEGEVNIQRLNLRGQYLDMLKALEQIKASKLQALPVSLNMSTAEDEADGLHWELVLWM